MVYSRITGRVHHYSNRLAFEAHTDGALHRDTHLSYRAGHSDLKTLVHSNCTDALTVSEHFKCYRLADMAAVSIKLEFHGA